jgi:hypothetical protein
MNLLTHELSDWCDLDVTMLCVGKVLGVFGEEIQTIMDVKPILWGDNETSRCLYQIVMVLAASKYLLYDEENEKFRLNPSFGLPADPKKTRRDS